MFHCSAGENHGRKLNSFPLDGFTERVCVCGGERSNEKVCTYMWEVLRSPVSKELVALEVLSQSSDMATTRTEYISPHLSAVIWQPAVVDVQLTDAPMLPTAVALYELAPNTKSQVTVAMPLEQL